MSDSTPPVVVGESAWVNRALGALAWLLALIFFFPVFWMLLNSFKEEQDANTSPKLFFEPTLDRYKEVTESAGGLLSFGEAFTNSAVIVLVSTADRAGARDPRGLRARDPARRQVARRPVLLHLDEVPARRRVDPARSGSSRATSSCSTRATS